MEELGNRLRAIRKNLKLTQSGFAKKINVLYETISKYETGKVLPCSQFLSKLYHAYNVDINWLITGKGSMFLGVNSSYSKNLTSIVKEKTEKYGIDKTTLDNILEYLKENPNEIESINKIIKTKQELKKNLKDFIDD